jgi:hypothetical protein
MIFAALIVFIIPGIFSIRYAFRSPPEAIDHFFRVPAIFIFFPEHNRLRLGRMTVGVFLLLVGIGSLLRELYHLIFGWS